MLAHMIGLDRCNNKKKTFTPSKTDKSEAKHQRNKTDVIETRTTTTNGPQNEVKALFQDSLKSSGSKTKLSANITTNLQKSLDHSTKQRGYSREPSQEKLMSSQKVGYQSIHGRGSPSSQKKPSTPTASSSNLTVAYLHKSRASATPDPSTLDVTNFLHFSSIFTYSSQQSEFSYAVAGGVFPRSKRKLHDNPNNVPGPGNYDIEQKSERKVSPHSFGTSARITAFDSPKSQTPGPQYYPTKHFTSKIA